MGGVDDAGRSRPEATDIIDKLPFPVWLLHAAFVVVVVIALKHVSLWHVSFVDILKMFLLLLGISESDSWLNSVIGSIRIFAESLSN